MQDGEDRKDQQIGYRVLDEAPDRHVDKPSRRSFLRMMAVVSGGLVGLTTVGEAAIIITRGIERKLNDAEKVEVIKFLEELTQHQPFAFPEKIGFTYYREATAKRLEHAYVEPDRDVTLSRATVGSESAQSEQEKSPFYMTEEDLEGGRDDLANFASLPETLNVLNRRAKELMSGKTPDGKVKIAQYLLEVDNFSLERFIIESPFLTNLYRTFKDEATQIMKKTILHQDIMGVTKEVADAAKRKQADEMEITQGLPRIMINGTPGTSDFAEVTFSWKDSAWAATDETFTLYVDQDGRINMDMSLMLLGAPISEDIENLQTSWSNFTQAVEFALAEKIANIQVGNGEKVQPQTKVV